MARNAGHFPHFLTIDLRNQTGWLTTQSGTNPSLPAIWEMQGDSDKMQGTVSVNPAKIRRISAAWTGLSLLKEQGGNPCLAGNVRDVMGAESRVKMERLWSSR